MTAALSLRGVHKRFGNTAVIQGVDLEVQTSERVAIIGPNGAGKSTLFHLISGKLQPQQGRIELHGQRIDGLPAHAIHRMGLARSFQITNLFAGMSVYENLRCSVLWSLGHGYSCWKLLSGMKDANERTEALLDQLGLGHKRHSMAMNLTYAEQRALELGVTLGSNSGVLLLDEPTAGMSRSETRHFIDLIRQVTHGKTLLMVEHDMGVVFELADKIAVLVHGQVMAYDTPTKVRENPQVQDAYLGVHISGATHHA
jgi:branched-chain amino acid transport system ATP-binding protein